MSYQIKWVGEDEVIPEKDVVPEPEKTYTQKEFDGHMAGLRKKSEASNEAMTKELETLKERSNLTAQERTDLESRLESLKEESMTKEQKLNKQLKKNETEWADKYKILEDQHNTLNTKYEDETINRAITNAALDGEAFSPEQIVAVLRPTTELMAELDDKKEPTGKMLVMGKHTGVDEDGKVVTENLPINEIVKKMREDTNRFGNLFKTNNTSGVGGGNRDKDNSGTKYDGNMSAFMKNRRKGKD